MRVRGVAAVFMVGAVCLPAIAGAEAVFKGPMPPASASGRPSGIVVGNFDESDPALDAVVASVPPGDTRSVTFLLGFNDGSLSNIDSFETGNQLSAIVTEDFDNDHHLDLVVASANGDHILFLKGGGDGTFAVTGDPITVEPNPMGLAVADFDNNGRMDIAVACEGVSGAAAGTITVLRGGGDGTFTEAVKLTAERGTRAVAIGHVDGDTLLDIVALNNGAGSASVFFGKTPFTFAGATKVTTGQNPDALALGDLNGDGTSDIVTADLDDNAVSVIVANKNRTFAPRMAFPVGKGPEAVVIGELSGDGFADVVTANYSSGDVSVLLGDGTGKLGPARHFVSELEPLAIALGNFNDDGRLDVVTANSDGSVWVFTNDGDGRLAATEALSAGSPPSRVAAGDLDDDGFPDLLATEESGVLAFRALAGGGFTAGEMVATVPGEAVDVALADFNRDGLADLAIADDMVSGSDDVVVALGNGDGTFRSSPASFAIANSPVAITTGDFNGDHIVDLAVAGDGTPGSVSVLLGRRDGSFEPFKAQVVEDTPVAIAAGDSNCDGADDLLVVNTALHKTPPAAGPGAISVLVSNRNGTFTPKPAITDAGERPAAIAVADFDRDGHPDFAVTNGIAGADGYTLHVFLGRSQLCDGSYSFFFGATSGDPVAPLVARDLVRDRSEPAGSRFVDLAVGNSPSNVVKVFRGKGDGKFASGGFESSIVSRAPVAIAAADFDGDGRYDVATANSASDSSNVSVLTNIPCKSGTSLPGSCTRGECFKKSAGGLTELYSCTAPNTWTKGASELRGDGNGDGRVSAADMVALARELSDDDGVQVEDTLRDPLGFQATVGVDANGDGRVDLQDSKATVRRIFAGG